MRRLILVLLIGAAITMVPDQASAGNQQVAEQIAANLRESGLLHGYKISVKYQDGVASLKGLVHSEEQMNTALKLVFQTAGVVRVVNDLEIGQDEAASQPLQLAAGAMAPENRRRPAAPSGFGVTPSRPINMNPAPTAPQIAAATPQAPMAPLQQPMGLSIPAPASAHRVATSFTPSPVLPVAATVPQQPMLAPAYEPIAPAAMPMPTAPPMMAAQPMPLPATVAAPMASHVAPVQSVPQVAMMPSNRPMPVAYTQGAPMPMSQAPMAPAGYVSPMSHGPATACYDQPHLPNYAWPSYAPHPNYAAVSYPKKHGAHAWPYIGPHHPYPQVPMGWRKVSLEWHDGYWNIDFDDGMSKNPFSGLFRPRQ